MVSRYVNPANTGLTNVSVVSVNLPPTHTSKHVVDAVFPRSQDVVCVIPRPDAFTEHDGSKTYWFDVTKVEARSCFPGTLKNAFERALRRLKLSWRDKVHVTTVKTMKTPPYVPDRKRTKSRKGESHRRTPLAVGYTPVAAAATAAGRSRR